MRRGAWLGLGLLVVIVAVLVMLRGTVRNDSPEHSSASDAGNGTSALRYYAQALGRATGSVEGDFALPSSPALLFVFSPSETQGYSLSEAQKLYAWVSSGNVVVYAAENGDPVLDTQFGLQRSRGTVDADTAVARPTISGRVGARFGH